MESEFAASTFGNEDRLPRVPLPTLEDSCERFLAWCGPLLTADELARTRAGVEEFLRPDGAARRTQPILQQDTERLDGFWDDRYLGRRDRIALNANFFFLFRDSELGRWSGRPSLVSAALEHKTLIDEERLAPVVQRGQGDVDGAEQVPVLHHADPRVPADTLRAPYGDGRPSDARHIVVFHRGTAFRLDVIAADGRPYAPGDIADGLRAVLAAEGERGAGVGALTTKARAEWADSRQALLALDPRNTDALDTVETALFCLCLEDAVPVDTLEACAGLLHGDCGNRWFDKAISLIVFGDGTSGVNVEHARLDGTTVAAFVDTLLAAEAAPSGGTGTPPSCTPVEFVLDDALKADVRDAAAAFTAYAEDLVTAVLPFETFGGEWAKKAGISPDAFVQMSVQLAHRRSRGFTGATYESIATRLFRHGRTEAMRVVTPESLRFVAAMEDASADERTREAALRTAAEAHVARARACQAGQAPEQHLWELQLVGKRHGETDFPLQETPGWRIMRDDCLSTSSVASDSIDYFGFGPTGAQCIGVAYMLRPGGLSVHLSAPRPLSGELKKFADALRASVRDLQDLLS